MWEIRAKTKPKGAKVIMFGLKFIRLEGKVQNCVAQMVGGAGSGGL